jgi:hypothetical protein
MVVKMVSHKKSKSLLSENNPCVVTDSLYDALIWRQDDAFVQNDSARLAD